MDPDSASELPPSLHEVLASAYSHYVDTATSRYAAGRREAGAAVADLVAAAKARGWPLRILAEPCGVSDERLRQIVKEYATGASSPEAGEIPCYSPPARKAKRPAPVRPHLTASQAERLRELAPLAKLNSGAQAADSPYRRASEELSVLIREHHDTGVIWTELSDATRPWTQWPIPDSTLDEIRRTEAAGGDSDMPPELRVSGLRMRAARHR